MRVLIVSKTRMKGGGFCVGGLTLDGNHTPIRLMNQDGVRYQSATTPYAVGDVWDLQFTPVTNVTPPHVENVAVTRWRREGPQPDFLQYLLQNAPIWRGCPDMLFDNLLNAENEKGFLVRGARLPPNSTGFWISDQPVTLVTTDQRSHYLYQGDSQIRRIAYAGVEDPLPTIGPGILIRVSLARWWDGNGRYDLEHAYLQLSGWYS